MSLLFLSEAGFDVKQYRYYDCKTKNLDFNGLIDDINVIIKIKTWLFLYFKNRILFLKKRKFQKNP